jgi:dephospho-CoA kinase
VAGLAGFRTNEFAGLSIARRSKNEAGHEHFGKLHATSRRNRAGLPTARKESRNRFSLAGTPMRLIGLTGGIATGKSTVSQMLKQMGAHVIDADQLARDVVEPGQTALLEIAERFPGAIDSDGRLNRKRLGERIFSNPQERLALNAILHPRIQEAFRKKVAQAEADGVSWLVYDVPLLFENGLESQLDDIVVVYVPEETQVERLMARDNLSSEQAKLRLQSQWPIERKKSLATWVVDNSQSIEATLRQARQIYRSISGACSVQ